MAGWPQDEEATDRRTAISISHAEDRMRTAFPTTRRGLHAPVARSRTGPTQPERLCGVGLGSGSSGPGASPLSPLPWFLPGSIRIRGGLSAAVFQRLAFSPGKPPGSHHRPRAINLDSSSNTYRAAPARRVDSGGSPAKPPGRSHWPPKPLLGAARAALLTKALIPSEKMD